MVVDNLAIFFTHVGYDGVICSCRHPFCSVLLGDKMVVVVVMIKAPAQLAIEGCDVF